MSLSDSGGFCSQVHGAGGHRVSGRNLTVRVHLHRDVSHVFSCDDGGLDVGDVSF